MSHVKGSATVPVTKDRYSGGKGKGPAGRRLREVSSRLKRTPRTQGRRPAGDPPPPRRGRGRRRVALGWRGGRPVYALTRRGLLPARLFLALGVRRWGVSPPRTQTRSKSRWRFRARDPDEDGTPTPVASSPGPQTALRADDLKFSTLAFRKVPL